jgi:nicotinic acid mononucleotide adenylyltransferase
MENYSIVDLDILEISSTLVREMIRNKQKVHKILTPWVFHYITKNNLYAY